MSPPGVYERPTLAERFWSRVAKSDGCWLWTAAVDLSGYGTVKVAGRSRGAHRVAYEMERGEIPAGLTLDHLCRNRRCVRPDHLEAVTIRENTLRGETGPAANAQKDRCPRGHQYSGTNSQGRRICRPCANAGDRRRAALKRQSQKP